MNSLVIPAYNEAKRINRTIKELLKLKGFELIFVVDGTDSTESIIKHYAHKYRNIKLFTPKSKGKWSAIFYGLKKTGGKLVGFVDADLPVTLENIKQGFKLAAKNDLVIGSRNIKGSKANRSFIRNIYSRVFNLYIRLLYLLPYSDTQCGFKVFKRSVLKKLFPLKGLSWEGDVELLYKARKYGLSVHEMPVTWVEEQGSHLGFKAKLSMLINLLKLRFVL